MTRKKTIILFSVFIFLHEAVFSSTVNFFTKEMKWQIQNGISLEHGTDFAPSTENIDLYASINMKELYHSTGVKILSETLNFTTETIYWPTFFGCLNLGTGSIFHINHTSNYFFETDFLTGFYAKYDTKKWFYISSNIMYMLKTSRIFLGNGNYLKILNKNMALKLELGFRPTEKIDIIFDFSSYSYYRYMLFFAPDFKLEASYKLSKMFAIGTATEVQYIDMFTLSANFNSASFRFFVNMEF